MSESRKNSSRCLLEHLPLFLLPLLSLLLYLPALHHDFIMDDTMLVVANPYITSWKQKALFYYGKAFGLNPWSAYIRERVAALENSLHHGDSSPSSAP